MIHYPRLKSSATIGITAPSSGVQEELHHLIDQSIERMEERGFSVVCGETVWTQDKSASAPAAQRARELNQMLKDPSIDLIIPPWGGQLLIEILEYTDMKKIDKKWILGYSDTSVLLLALTLKTGMATAHGVNLVDLRGKKTDDITAKWRDVLSTEEGGTVEQYSSEKYQREWDYENPTEVVYNLNEPTEWKSIACRGESFSGRLLGGCIDVIQHLVGTPFGDVEGFRKNFISDDPIVWYFENCELNTAGVRRAMVQMRLAGWFDNCSGILFGRSSANDPVDNYEIEDVYKALSEELSIPVVYDIDCGHVPPQVTFINGAWADVEVENGKGKVRQTFK
ncbi:S66 peptidase family protein [Jeotgalibacillus sp. R-1-5s-1]|uniref:S66 family peptidase n=1 Tax=Jeotgalibacillus sp. R-1-5s-1 TaxID=2555897 RepID=UPI00106CE246|nr:S66 peptidase family protein [Jeotgalibacillus sp. R-1-5s-1]TFE01823.1 LD-carboxypeptidase [Jeotgalibacillus sp. R-1-5s-1]